MQDPFADAWDSAGTATADPFAAAWDSAPASDPRADLEASGAIPRRRTPLSQHPGTETAAPGGGALGDLASYEGASFAAMGNRALNFPLKLTNKAMRLGELGLSAVMGTPPPEESRYVPELPEVTAAHDPLADVAGEGVGMLATGAAAAPLVTGAPLLPAAAMGATLNGVDMHQRVLQETGDPDKAMTALVLGMGVGSATALPVGRVLSRWNQDSGGVLVRALGDLGTGFGTMSAQRAVNNVIEKHATGKDIPILQGALEDGQMGALATLIAGGLAGAAGAHGKAGPERTLGAEFDAGAAPDAQPDAGKPHAAIVPKEQSARPIEEPARAVESDAAPPEGLGGVSEAAPELAAKRGKESAETVEPTSAQEQANETESVPGGATDEVIPGDSPGGRVDEHGAAPATKLRLPVRAKGALGMLSDPLGPMRLVEAAADFITKKRGPNLRPDQRVEREQVLPKEHLRRALTDLTGVDIVDDNAQRLADSAADMVERHLRDARKEMVTTNVPAMIEKARASLREEFNFSRENGMQAREAEEFQAASRALSEMKSRPDAEDVRAVARTLAYQDRPTQAYDKIPDDTDSGSKYRLGLTAPGGSPLIYKIGGLSQHVADLFGAKPRVGGKPTETLRSPEEGFYPSRETKWQTTQRKIADRFVKLRGTEQEAPGKGSDFSGAETRMHGRAAHAQDLLERAQDRAVRLMKNAGMSAQDIADYATARHAGTRNKIIEERTAGENKEGSGMSAARAREILDNASPAAEQVMKVHDEVRDKALSFAVESGLLSADEAKAWTDKFGDTFTSLKTIGDDEPRSMPGVAKSLQVRGKEAKRAEGRESEATNPLVSMFQNAQDVILRGEKNIVAQEFGKLVKQNPGPWAEFEEPDGAHAPSGEDVFTYKENGEPRYIRVRDDATLKAIKNLDPVAAGTLLRLAGKAGRLMSGLATSRNPDFIASNLARDLQTAVGNTTAEESVKTAAKIVKDVVPSLREMFKAARKPEEAKGYAKEYLEHGALTDWIEPTTPQKRLADMEKRLAETPVKEKLRALADAVSDVSGAVENATRFAYFKALREQGMSADDAAVRAKELTVNWSKKGEWSGVMNALYLFSSASANGTVRFAQAWVRNPQRAAAYAGSLMAAGYFMAMLNHTAGGKDEKDGKDWIDKQSEANKRRAALIQHQNGTTTKLPLAPGWGLFYYLGGKLYDSQDSGKVDTGNIVGAVVDQASPIGGGSLAQVVSPWFLDPFVSVSENKDYAGREIYSRDERDNRPYSALPNEQRASKTAQTISKLANELTGGNESRQGSVDISPKGLDYVAGESASGAGRFMQEVGKTASAIMHGDKLMWRDMPLISRFEGDAPKTYSRDFYSNLRAIDVEDTAAKGGKKYDATALAYKKAAEHTRDQIATLRKAGLDDQADNLAAQFNKAFAARRKR